MVLLLVDLIRIDDSLSTGFIIHFMEVIALPEPSLLSQLSSRLILKIRSGRLIIRLLKDSKKQKGYDEVHCSSSSHMGRASRKTCREGE